MEPAHWLCKNWYENGKKGILQAHSKAEVGRYHNHKCPGCAAMVQAREWLSWLT